MILIVGLGNPGAKYAATRHNLGYRVVDGLAEGATFRDRFHGEYATGTLGGEPVAYLKPTTFMNDSGRSVQAALAFTKLDKRELLVVHDELDLPFGDVRLKHGGGHAGNNGIRSVSAAIGPEYARVRIGIGRPPPEFQGAVADYVLSGFSLSERAALDEVLGRAREAVTAFVVRGLSDAMNATNRRAR